MTISKIEFDFENPFMPKEPMALTKNEEDFLKIYSIFAKNMNYLCEYRDWEGFKGSPQCSKKEDEVIQNAEAALQYLKKNPLSNKKITEEMVEFLDVTYKSLKFGTWLGKDFLSVEKEVHNQFLQPPTHEPEELVLGRACPDAYESGVLY